MQFKPHDYQEYTINKILEVPKIACILDMGLGKTVSALTAMDELMFNRLELDKVLVIAPLKVARDTWPDEIKKWDHLKNLRVAVMAGAKEEERLKALDSRSDIYTINRENTQWLIDTCVKRKKWPFDCIIIDESSSFKNPQSKRFKALRKVTAISKRVILLTGTPAPNSLMDLWSQMYLLDAGARLGHTLTAYRNEYFNPGQRNKNVVFNYVPKKGAEEAIYKSISDIAVSLKACDHLKNLPERIDNTIEIKMDPKTEKLYKTMETDYLIHFDESTIVATSAGVVANKLLQMANGAVYDENKNVVLIHDLKLEALADIIECNEGTPIMVFYNYQHDYDRLMAYFKDLEPRTLKTHEDQEDWNEGRIRLLLAHPASMGHGLNLQAGGHIIVWFSLTWSLELYQQANARLHRQGQKESVIVHHLVVRGTEDETAIRRLKSKEVTQDELIEAVKARIKRAKNTLNEKD